MDPRVSQTAAARAALEGGHPRHPVPPMPWADRAACRGMTALMFPHPGDRDGIAAAKRVCATCPVRAECRDHATRWESGAVTDGVWAGRTAQERQSARRARRRVDRLARYRQEAVA